MHRVLTGYSNYYNRKHKRVGHLLQARHKSILCQSDRYLAELVRYIHLNPVRAGMVNLPEEYKYSGHAAYLGLVPAGILDIDPVLRHFGARKKQARQAYQQFVNAGIALGHQDSWYSGEDNRILGNEEFVDSVIHHIGETRGVNARSRDDAKYEFKPKLLLEAVEQICGISRGVICSSAKHRAAIAAKEVLVLTGSQLGATRNQLSDLTGMSESAISRRKDAADVKARWLASFRKLTASVLASYQNRCSEIAKSQA
jgi:hypothetical protein